MSQPPSAGAEARREILLCAHLHAGLEADRATLNHECLVQDAAMRRLLSRMCIEAHLPLEHVAAGAHGAAPVSPP